MLENGGFGQGAELMGVGRALIGARLTQGSRVFLFARSVSVIYLVDVLFQAYIWLLQPIFLWKIEIKM